MRPALRLWFLFLAGLNVVIAVQTVLKAPVSWGNVAVAVLTALAALLLMATRRKIWFYLMCAASVLSIAVNAVGSEEPMTAAVSALLMPMLTFLLMKKEWNEFK